MASLLSDSDYQELEIAGHMPMFESPEKTAGAINVLMNLSKKINHGN
jgi:hypothetical protein